MLTYWNYKHGLQAQEKWEPNCWVQATCPTEDEEKYLIEELHIPDYFLNDIRDKDERARYDYDEGWMLIILRIPYQKEEQSRTPHTTIPLGVLLNREVCVSVCHFETDMMLDFVSYQKRRGLGFADSVDFVFRLFLSSAVWYLKRLKQISTLIDSAKRDLDRPINNSDLINLSRLQDSLTYFATAIRGNETLLSKLKFKLPVDELDADMIEDVNIEMSQARETTGIYANRLEPDDENDDLGEHHSHVPHPHRQHLRYELAQRHGTLDVGFPHHHRRFRRRLHSLCLVLPAHRLDLMLQSTFSQANNDKNDYAPIFLR